MLDRDGNGFISKQELGMAMRSLGYMPSEVELAIIMQRLDMDGESHVPAGVRMYCAMQVCLMSRVMYEHKKNLHQKNVLMHVLIGKTDLQ